MPYASTRSPYGFRDHFFVCASRVTEQSWKQIEFPFSCPLLHCTFVKRLPASIFDHQVVWMTVTKRKKHVLPTFEQCCENHRNSYVTNEFGVFHGNLTRLQPVDSILRGRSRS